jgi:hypothetical protein
MAGSGCRFVSVVCALKIRTGRPVLAETALETFLGKATSTSDDVGHSTSHPFPKEDSFL